MLLGEAMHNEVPLRRGQIKDGALRSDNGMAGDACWIMLRLP
jgi:hypothetical protein